MYNDHYFGEHEWSIHHLPPLPACTYVVVGLYTERCNLTLAQHFKRFLSRPLNPEKAFPRAFLKSSHQLFSRLAVQNLKQANSHRRQHIVLKSSQFSQNQLRIHYVVLPLESVFLLRDTSELSSIPEPWLIHGCFFTLIHSLCVCVKSPVKSQANHKNTFTSTFTAQTFPDVRYILKCYIHHNICALLSCVGGIAFGH